MIGKLWRTSTGHTIRTSLSGGHVVRDGAINAWVTLYPDEGRWEHAYAYLVNGAGTTDDFINCQNYASEIMYNSTNWVVGIVNPVSYIGFGWAPGQYASMQHSEAYYCNTAHKFVVPAYLSGHTITGVRLLYNGMGMLRRNYYESGIIYVDTNTYRGIRFRTAATLGTPFSCFTAGSTQILSSTFTAWTNSISGQTKTLWDIWEWNRGDDKKIPIFTPTANNWYPITMNANAVSLLNTNRSFWIHSGFTEELQTYGGYGNLTCTNASGVCIQIYVE